MDSRPASGASRPAITRRRFAGSLAASALGLPVGCGDGPRQAGARSGRRVVVLGLDGLDPKILKALMDQGRAPNFSKLAARGSFQPLGTTMPALSPVAWSTFITGTDPGSHTIADFVMRDPATYQPYFSIWETEPPARELSLGEYRIAIGGPGVVNRRVGVPFWTYLADAGIPSTVIKIPTNFPVDDTATRALSGMGTPDLVDSLGRFNYYTSDAKEDIPGLTGGTLHRIKVSGGRVRTGLPGPGNSLREDGRETSAEFTVDVDPNNDAVLVEIQGQRILLQKGEYSDWIAVRFDLASWLVGVSGICRFYLRQVHPHLKLYVTPINIDPSAQSMPVSHPPEVGGEIASQIGPFWTKGLPSDTRALDYRILDDEAYVKQAELILEDRLRLFEHEWDRFSDGLFFFYVSSTDQDTHMLWRNMDKTHPMHDASDVRFSGYIHHLYEEMDRLVGRVLPAADDDTLLLICSDHGFAPFGRQFHLNSWLRREGYLAVKDEAASKEVANVEDIDWPKTAAYGIGFNGLYMNRVGREGQGTLGDGEAERVSARIATELEAIRDSDTGERPVHRVYRRSELYQGEFSSDMPELLVGYTPGYRSSSGSVMGESGKEILDINPWAWAGDHSMARDLVPGCLFSSQPLAGANPNIKDLPVTILQFFGLRQPFGMQGTSLL
ncbi:MAG: alkaline phosphatase family protein [Bryobacterales bacterium]|nr:alkaline phosphatase family protein [Bryobacterales bacterium]